VVRLALEAEYPDLRQQWISERALAWKRRQEDGSWHLPDGAVEVDAPPERPNLEQALLAVEVELTPKSRLNLAQIIKTLPGETVAVSYFAPARDVENLQLALAKLVTGRRPPLRVEVRPLPEVEGLTYEGDQ
jgi:hypothetical protein